MAKAKEISEAVAPSVARMVEDMVGCKWSLAVLAQIRAGVKRPGEIERAIPGLSQKVMNERLRKLQRFGIVERRVFAEVPPHVEYRLTRFGGRFSKLLDGIERLQQALDQQR
jgi:DNA-binding HxlR family transcriptional regulator